jgi:osmotically-inducible protein OsmY
MTAPEPKQYVVARVQEALAHDPRVGELDVHVKVVGDKVFLSGEVPTNERRGAISTVVAELLPESEVHNEVVVSRRDEDPDPESLT